ncbi:MAG: TrbI/VirB10 family protein [Wolbachia endosymbiont of Fragariocoptes setiger]|nr:TrbI/VirB10 family protein [Wolbachia endosymbiont of Fragariocoptes setiger]
MNQNNLENDLNSESEIESKVVTVGSHKSKKIITILLLSLLTGIVYYLYFSSHNKEESEITKKSEETKKNVKEIKEKLESIPEVIPSSERTPLMNTLPPLPPLAEPKAIPEIKPEVTPKEEKQKLKEPKSSIPSLRDNSPNTEVNNITPSFPTITSHGYSRERRNTGMLAISNGDGGLKVNESDSTLSTTSSQQSKATKVGRLDRMITQGKIIDAVLETAIATDLQGTIRALVSRDIYAEAGDSVLIPRGSRLIGNYSFDSNIAKARVNISWNRIILPHGIDIAISSPGIDAVGRAGITGVVDYKIISTLFSSILLAGTTMGALLAAKKVSTAIGELTFMEYIRSINIKEINLFPLLDLLGVPKDSDKKEDDYKLGVKSIIKIKNAKNEDNLVSIFRDEVKLKLESLQSNVDTNKNTVNVEEINLEVIKMLLAQQKDGSMYQSVAQNAAVGFHNDMKNLIERSIDKKPTLYVDQGTALKVFVNQDITFPPEAILLR